MEQKYKLLKDLPSVKAGIIGLYNESDSEYTFWGFNIIKLHEDIVENNPDWFEPLIDYKAELEKMGFECKAQVLGTLGVYAKKTNGNVTIYADNYKAIYEVLKGGCND